MKKRMINSINRTNWKLLILSFCLPCLPYAYNYAADVAVPGIEATQQQKQTITGVVLDNLNEPVIGANVVEKGTTNGTITGMDGEFTLSVALGAELEVTYIGYVNQTVPVRGSVVNITLQEDTQLLGEVVVTGFGLSQKKATLTGAISSINSDDLSRSSASTASGALVGKMPGLNYRQKDGRPGASTKLQIRNMGTPLYVIDGIVKDEGQFNNINFNDIESIAILKDASASIYGVRAANGVVVVTTKKGKRNSKNTVSLDTYYGWQTPARFAKPADAVTYIENFIQSETIQGATSYRYSKEDLEKWKQGTEKGYQPFDWYDYVWKTSPQYYANVNVSGGSDKINYYLSVAHLNQKAMIRDYGGFERTNAQMNIEAQINDRLRVGASMNGRIETRVNPGVPGADDYWAPVFGVYRNLPTRRPFANDNPDYPALTSTDSSTNFAMLNYDRSGKYQEDWRVIQLNMDVEYKLFDGLTAKALLGYYYANQNLNNQEYTYKLYDYDEENDEYVVVTDMSNPWRERRMGYNEELTSNIQLNYNNTFGKHTVGAIVGFEASRRDEPSTWLHSLPASNALSLIYFSTMDTYDDTGKERRARMGYISRLNYDYDNKYLFEFSGRYDGSWKFPPGDRWGFFPSASVGWRISEEGFWKNAKINDVFHDFKIRASYGLVGDDDLGDAYKAFDYMTGYTYGEGSGVIDGEYVIGTQPRGLPVTSLTWIKAQILDIGFDASFFNNRLTGTFDFFRRKRTGLPASRYDVLIPSEVGFSLPQENLNSDVHMGYDMMVRWSDQIKEVGYSIGANITYARRFAWEQYKPRYSNSWDEYRNTRWHRFSDVYWGYVSDGQFQSWEEIASYPIDIDGKGNATLRPGDIKYKDMNGDGIIDGYDQRPIGYSASEDDDLTPVLNFGLNLAVTWKGFDLAIDLAGGAMSSFFQEWELRNPFHDGGNNPQFLMSDTWRLADIWDANSELIPGKYPTLIEGNSSHSNYWASDFWLHKVNYVKLRNLEFGYTLPKRWIEKAQISDLRIYLAGQNLFTITNIPGVDPEGLKTSGLSYPTTRVINIGLNIKF